MGGRGFGPGRVKPYRQVWQATFRRPSIDGASILPRRRLFRAALGLESLSDVMLVVFCWACLKSPSSASESWSGSVWKLCERLWLRRGKGTNCPMSSWCWYSCRSLPYSKNELEKCEAIGKRRWRSSPKSCQDIWVSTAIDRCIGSPSLGLNIVFFYLLRVNDIRA